MDTVPTLSKVPGYNLYIGGPKALENCRITHIVSVIDWKFDQDSPLIKGYKHLHIPADDVDDENLITWFPRSNAFIEDGLRQTNTHGNANADAQNGGVDKVEDAGTGPGVLIHW